MCCTGNHQQSHSHACGCGCQTQSQCGPMLWSKKKRLEMIDHSIKCLQTQVKDLEELRKELAAEK